jgi:hypothetical protein
MDRGSRPPDMSNFCCLPGRAGGTPLLVRIGTTANQTFRDCHHSGAGRFAHTLVAFLNEWSRVMTNPNNIKLNPEIPAERELTSDELELVFGGALPPVWHCDASAGDPVCTQK